MTTSDSQATEGVRRAPRHPVFLRSAALSVEFDGLDGLPYRYTFAGQSIWGEGGGNPVRAILCSLTPRRFVTIPVKVVAVNAGTDQVVFRYEVHHEDEPGAWFSLKYAIHGASLIVTMEDVVEDPGYELIEVALPDLATVREKDRGAWITQGRDCGSFVRLAEAKAHRYEDDDNFGRISIQLPIGMVGSGEIACMMEVSAFMDGTETEIALHQGERVARMGTIQVHRVHGGRCYNMNDGGDAVCGDAHTPNLLVGQTPRCRFDFFQVEDASTPWFAGAKILRDRMPASPTKYFDDKFVFMIAGRNKTDPEPKTTFAQSSMLLRDIAQLTDYAPLVAYISGWVYDGQDTGYPSEDKVNASLGSYDELMKLMADSRQLNVNVSVNVNYDDAYKSSPEFDTAFIAREPNGAIWKSRPWDGEDSYIVGMAKYVLGGWAKRRIEKTMARYKLRNAMLIDAMSWFTIRNDWDPKHPASGYKNLVEGKWAIIEEFRKRGVNVTSEQFRYPMLGKLALTVDGPEPAPCPFGGEQIPLTAMVYRKSTIFGSSGNGAVRPHQDLFWNSRPGVWYEHATDRKTITDFYYLVVLPYNKVHTRDVVSYTTRGAVREIELEGSSKIAIDAAARTYTVTLEGATIAQGESTCCPVDADRIAFYSRAGGRLAYPLPKEWDEAAVAARALTVEGRRPFPVKIEEGQIVVEVPARSPVMVYSREQAIHPLPNLG
jgi:hypothetical protein